MKKHIEVNILFLTIIVIQLFSCAGTNYKKLSLEDPNALIAIEDSLLSVNKNNQSINNAIVVANNNVASNPLASGNKSANFLSCSSGSSRAIISTKAS